MFPIRIQMDFRSLDPNPHKLNKGSKHWFANFFLQKSKLKWEKKQVTENTTVYQHWIVGFCFMWIYFRFGQNSLQKCWVMGQGKCWFSKKCFYFNIMSSLGTHNHVLFLQIFYYFVIILKTCRTMADISLAAADGVILVYSLSESESFEEVTAMFSF